MEDSSDKRGYAGYKLAGLFLGPLLFLCVLLAPTPEGMSAEAQRAGAVAALMAVWWIFEAIPLSATALGAFGFVSFVGRDFGGGGVRRLWGFEYFSVCRRFLHCDGDAKVEFARADCVASGEADWLASAGFGGRVYVGDGVFVDVDIQYGDGVDDVADCVGGCGDGGQECGRPRRGRLCGLRSFGDCLFGEHRRGGHFDWDAA